MYHSIQLTETTSSRRTPISRWRRWHRCILRSLTVGPAILLLLLASATAFCGSETWLLDPTNNIWDGFAFPTNWIPETIPNGPTDTATFDVSNTIDVSVED